MKLSKVTFRLGVLILAPLAAPAAIVISSGTLNTTIPDQSNTGLAHSLTVDDAFTVGSVSVSLSLSVPAGSTGWFGDLYAYVQHDTGLAVLLNRPGRAVGNIAGYDDGQSAALTFNDGAVNGDIHTYRLTLNGDNSIPLTSALTGTWQPDGRALDPAVVLTSDARTATLSQFNGLGSSGTWTLFLADLSGGGQYQLNHWSVNLAAVPEPVHVGLATAGLLVAWAWFRPRRR